MKITWKKTLALLLALVMVLGLTACGKKGEEAVSYEGTWLCIRVDYLEDGSTEPFMSGSLKDLEADDSQTSIILNAGGKGTMTSGSDAADSFNVTWTQADAAITISGNLDALGVESMVLSIQNDQLVWEYAEDGMSMRMTFARDGSDAVTQARATSLADSMDPDAALNALSGGNAAEGCPELALDGQVELTFTADSWFEYCSFTAPADGDYAFWADGETGTDSNANIYDAPECAEMIDSAYSTDTEGFAYTRTMAQGDTLYFECYLLDEEEGSFVVHAAEALPGEDMQALELGEGLELGFADYNDYFTVSFTAPQAGDYRFYSESDIDPYISVYRDADCTDMIDTADDTDEDANFSLVCTLEADQTVYLDVSTWSSDGGLVTVFAESSEEKQAEDSGKKGGKGETGGSAGIPTTPTENGSLQTLTLNTPIGALFGDYYDYHYYQFTAPAAGTYYFWTESDIDTGVDVYSDADYSDWLASADDTGSYDDFLLELDLTARQTIYLEVETYTSETPCGYLICATDNAATQAAGMSALSGGSAAASATPAAPAVSSVVIPTTPTEDGSMQTLTLNTPLGALFGSYFDYHYYTFTAPAAGIYYIWTESDMDTQVDVYSDAAYDNWIDSADDDDNSSDFLLEISLTAGQTIYLEVESYTSTTPCGYLICATDNMAAVTAGIAALSGSVAAVPAVSGGSAAQQLWNGDWYGWWWVYDATNYYSELDEGWWDCYANISIDASGLGSISLWDDDMYLADLTVAATDQSLVVTGGDFVDMAITPNQWMAIPASMEYDSCIQFVGTYVDPTQPAESFTFEIWLRPWGMKWDDVSDEYDRPPYYDWYLGELDAGNAMATCPY